MLMILFEFMYISFTLLFLLFIIFVIVAINKFMGSLRCSSQVFIIVLNLVLIELNALTNQFSIDLISCKL